MRVRSASSDCSTTPASPRLLQSSAHEAGGNATAEAAFNLPTDLAQYSAATQEQAPILMAKLKAPA